MQRSVLQDFLRLRLLDIGAEDSRLDKLHKVCEELAQRFSAEPRTALPPLLAALSPTSGDDPALLAIGSVVEKHWPTYRSAFQDEPITVYRATVLEAVMRAMEQQGVLAVAVKLLGENILPHTNVGREQEPLSVLLAHAKSITTIRLEEQWPGQTEPVSIPPLAVPQIPTAKKADPNTWLLPVIASAGPGTNKSGVTMPASPNPSWPNNVPQWSYDFADRIAPVFADVYDKAVATATKNSAQAVQALGNSMIARLEEFLSEESAKAAQRHTSSRLLWWRQSLYSESALAPYRKLSRPLIALHMALDLAELLPEVYPPAVESLLYEAVRAAAGQDCREPITMGELLEGQRQALQVATLEALERYRTASELRTLFVQALANSHAAGKAELQRLCVDLETKMELGDWAIWLLREVKALKALTSPDDIEQLEQSEQTEEAA